MTATSQKAKGPASVGALPDHGSTNPTKDMDMNTDSNSMAAAARPEFPIPYLSQDPEDDLRDVLSIFRILDHHFDAGCMRGLDKEMVCDIATMLSMARELLLPIQRYLNNDMRDGTTELYHAARRAEILASFQRGQA